MKVLDLFCCCGGISKGIKNAIPDAKIIGVDITNDHDYPYGFVHHDVFTLPMEFLKDFDFIHASPPCQFYSWATHKEHRKDFPDLIDETRQLLFQTGKPFMLENVPNAPVKKDLMLCGEMFGLRVVRHRIFEIHGFTVLQPKHIKHRPHLDEKHSYYACVAGHGGHGYSRAISVWQDALGVDWVNKERHLTQMIPPAYSEYIAKFINFQ